MSKFRHRPTVVEASQWWKSGDHPNDYTEDRPFMENGQFRMKPGAFFKEHDWEGAVVRYYRHPAVDGDHRCEHCGFQMHDHGWIDSAQGVQGGHTVCPGDWIVTEMDGQGYYPVKPAVFTATYDPAEVQP